MRKFNPGLLQTDAEVAAQFVVRKNEFNTVCEVIRGNIASPSCQHALVVGSRGQGKSMLLRRVAAELRMDSELSEHYLPVQFMEENQEVDNLADFWIETLFQLARELASEDKALSNELTTTHDSLVSRWREQGFENLARSAVLDAADRVGRRLVLMVENVQSLFSESGEDFGWGLRAVLQTIPQITLIASATSRFEALDDPRAPFFELFHYVYLKPLNTEECGTLWSVVSKTESSTNEVRPLEILTGGNPRLIVVVASFAQHRSIRQLMEELVVLVDEHSEYFRSHLDLLPKNERRVFIALIDLWQPSNASSIAARARLDVRVVSTMLKRLIERGVVMIADGYGARKRLYVASERLFSIFYKLRRENDERSVVESLIHFMVSFYDVREVYMITEQLFADAVASSAIHEGIESALASRPQSSETNLRLKWDEVARASAKVDDERQTHMRRRLMEEIVKARQTKNWQELIDFAQHCVTEGFLDKGSPDDREINRIIVSRTRSVAYLQLEQFDKVIDVGEKVETGLDEADDLRLLLGYCDVKLNQAQAHFSLSDCSRVRHECKKLVHQFSDINEPNIMGRVALAHLMYAEAENKIGDIATSITVLDKVINSYGDNNEELLQQFVAQAFFRKGVLLGLTHSSMRRSISCFDELFERYQHTENESIRLNLSDARMKQAFNYGLIGDFDQEIKQFERVIHSVREADGTQHKANCFYAWLYRSRRLAELSRATEAIASCDQAQLWTEKNPDLPLEAKQALIEWHVNCTRALALTHLGRTDVAIAALKRAYDAFDPERDSDLAQIMRLVSELLAAGAKEQDLISVFQSDEQRAWDLLPLTVALQQRTGAMVNAPVQALEIANDLQQCIEHRLVHGLQPGYSLSM